MSKIEIGSIFGRLTVIEPGKLVGRNRYWICKCDCGNFKEIAYSSLTKGSSKSCGCLNSEMASIRRTTHGKSKSSEYAIWVGMRQRCEDVNCAAYKNYGGRGINVCYEWSSFEKFFADMGPSNGGTLERKDNDKGYEITNCILDTRKSQANNRRSNIQIEFNNKTQTIQQWSEELGIPYFTLRARLVILNWTTKRALTEPIRKKSQPA